MSSENKFLPGVRGVGAHTQSGMIHSLLSPYPNDIPVLITEFLDLNRIPKTTVTDKLFNIVQTMNLLQCYLAVILFYYFLNILIDINDE